MSMRCIHRRPREARYGAGRRPGNSLRIAKLVFEHLKLTANSSLCDQPPMANALLAADLPDARIAPLDDMRGVRQASAERIIVFARHLCLTAARSQIFPRALPRPRGDRAAILFRVSRDSMGLRRNILPTGPPWTGLTRRSARKGLRYALNAHAGAAIASPT